MFAITKPNEKEEDRKSIRFQTEKEMDRSFSRWAARAINDAVQEQRFQAAGVSSSLVREIQSRVPILNKGLTQQNLATGKIEDASDESRVVSLIMPVALIMLMFMMVLIGSMPAMQGVVEEKQQRIAEVLLGSLTPFQLMLGKLIGVVAISLTVSSGFFSKPQAISDFTPSTIY